MDDLISRKIVLNVIEHYDIGKYGANKYLWDLIYEMPSSRPNVPDRKVGKWIDEGTNYSCSECYRGCWVNSDFCPWCGARMVRGKDDDRDTD